MRFVEEGLGDPFFKYLLLLARNQTLSLTDDRKVSFELFVPHEGPNTQQRAFFFESAAATGGATLAGPVNPGLVVPSGGISSVKKLHQSSADPAWTGKVIETIRIVITDTRGGRAEQIDQAAWEALPAHERGDIVHFVRDFAGREEPVDAETYESLEEERRGRREFYRRELPRLAEVEAVGLGRQHQPRPSRRGRHFGSDLGRQDAGTGFRRGYQQPLSAPHSRPPRPRWQRADHRHRRYGVAGPNSRHW